MISSLTLRGKGMTQALVLTLLLMAICVNGHAQDTCDLIRQLEHLECHHQETGQDHVYRDCADVKATNPSSASGIYTIEPADGKGSFPVLCDMTTDGGGWLVIQKRYDGSQDFYKTWKTYQEGFGDLNHEFWLGNEKIRRITKQKSYDLRFDLGDFEHNKKYEVYPNFKIASASDNYRLSVGKGHGTATDSFYRQNNHQFSARDKDVDAYSDHCAQMYHGAWWYDACHESNLNGVYNNTNYGMGLNWRHWRGYKYSLKSTEMKIRPLG